MKNYCGISANTLDPNDSGITSKPANFDTYDFTTLAILDSYKQNCKINPGCTVEETLTEEMEERYRSDIKSLEEFNKKRITCLV